MKRKHLNICIGLSWLYVNDNYVRFPTSVHLLKYIAPSTNVCFGKCSVVHIIQIQTTRKMKSKLTERQMQCVNIYSNLIKLKSTSKYVKQDYHGWCQQNSRIIIYSINRVSISIVLFAIFSHIQSNVVSNRISLFFFSNTAHVCYLFHYQTCYLQCMLHDIRYKCRIHRFHKFMVFFFMIEIKFRR